MQKKLYISLPDANPAPIIVPIITREILKIFLIKITYLILLNILKKITITDINIKGVLYEK